MKIEAKILSKAELLALFQERGLLIKPIDIVMAKQNVLIEKADVVFGTWKDCQLPAYGRTLDDHIVYLQATKKKEKIYEKWLRMTNKIDALHKQMMDMEY